jgi:hypothetical protein
MTPTSISHGIAGLALGLATISINCGSDPPDLASSPCLAVPTCSEGATSTTECRLTTQVVSSADRGASGIALDDGHVYLKAPLGVFFAPKTGGALAPFDGVAPPFPRTDSVTDGVYEYRGGSEGLARVSADGTSVAVAAPENVCDECFAITLRRGALYWTGADGILMGAPVGTGLPWVLDQAGGSDCDDDYEGLAVAADDTGIYWIAGDPGQRTSDEQPLTLYRTCRSETAATN